MRKLTIMLTAMSAIVMLACQPQEASSGKAINLDDEKQAFSYAIGLDIAASLAMYSDEVDLNALFEGIKDTLLNGKSQIAPEKADQLKKERFQKIQDVQKQKNVEKGQAFLDENKKKPDVKVTISGLQYTVITEGTGATPTVQDQVEVHYTGTLLNGKEFDSSRQRGKPAKFKVGGVIPGWTEALQLMKEGGRLKVFIPSNLAYGERGAGGRIGPNETLIFDMELLKVLK